MLQSGYVSDGSTLLATMSISHGVLRPSQPGSPPPPKPLHSRQSSCAGFNMRYRGDVQTRVQFISMLILSPIKQMSAHHLNSHTQAMNLFRRKKFYMVVRFQSPKIILTCFVISFVT